MKVVLFCGGQGLRLREYSENVPKPMVPIGSRPIMWHLMKYYAHYGHTDFIICLGHKADVIKSYFRNYDECVSNDFVISRGGRVKMLGRDIDDWNITFVDTGYDSNIGQRLMQVKEYIGDDEMFLANYSDNLTDVPLPTLIDHAKQQNKVASFLSVQPSSSFHLVQSDETGKVKDIVGATEAGLWINGGFFVLKREIFDHIHWGEELVIEPFRKLIGMDQLTTYRHNGFWACMDTFKEKMTLDDRWSKGNAPWLVWNEVQKKRVETLKKNGAAK